MGELLAAAEAEFETDFALLSAVQPGADAEPRQSFATSEPGYVGLMAGTKYARIRIRVERWSDRPPQIDGWEDCDELPFAEIPDGGPLLLSEFDRTDIGIDVSGVSRGRVQVFARGRHRYRYSEPGPDSLEPEEWLLRIFPQEGLPDPMAGGPRRIAGEGGLVIPRGTAWLEAVRGLDTAGWSRALGSSHGYSLARAIWQGPCTRAELASRMVRGMPPFEAGRTDAETIEIPPRTDTVDPLATAVGRASVPTAGDVIDAMRELGLLLAEQRGGVELMIVNPAPQPAWERLGLDPERTRSLRAHAMVSHRPEPSSDILSAVQWMGDRGLAVTMRRLALRWSTPLADIDAALRSLVGLRNIVSDREIDFVSDIDPDQVLVLRRPA